MRVCIGNHEPPLTEQAEAEIAGSTCETLPLRTAMEELVLWCKRRPATEICLVHSRALGSLAVLPVFSDLRFVLSCAAPLSLGIALERGLRADRREEASFLVFSLTQRPLIPGVRRCLLLLGSGSFVADATVLAAGGSA